MVQQDLLGYISEMLRRGYDANLIKNELLKAGYTKKDVAEAFNYIHTPEIKHTIHLSRSALVGISLLFLGMVIVAASLIITIDRKDKELLDISVAILTSRIEHGGLIEFNVNIINFGARNRYDAALSYIILDNTNQAVASKTETVALETRASLKSSIRVPDDAEAGDYILKATADYDGNTATASDSFKIIGEKEVGEAEGGIIRKALKCDDNNNCTKDFIRDGKCVYEAITPCCSNNLCEAGEEYISCPQDCAKPEEEERNEEPRTKSAEPEKASQLAKTSPQEALSYCAGIKKEETKDECYKSAADAASNSGICKNIVSDAKRDLCYTHFVTSGDYSVCEELTLKYLKDSCRQLKRLEELKNK